MKEYLKTKETVLEELGSSLDGLTTSNANERLQINGRNKLVETKKISFFNRLMKQLADPMIIVLIIAAVVSAAVALYEKESFIDSIIIILVVALNTILGMYQESKAEKAIEALKQMSGGKCKVIRDGEVAIISSEELVVGDVVVVETGDIIAADGRIIECASLKIEEAQLTGESNSVEKTSDCLETDAQDIILGERLNMVYAGSNVVYGRAKIVVCQTGMDTEIGKIANTINQSIDESTPLQIKLKQLSKNLSYIVLAICVVIFIFSMLKEQNYSSSHIIEVFMLAVSLAVAAIPEGLAAVVTVQLAIGVTKMSKQNAIIRKLTAVETLGCTQVICSDKTGTLTQNKMIVEKVDAGNERMLALAMGLCNDATINSDGTVLGEATEIALKMYSSQYLGDSKVEMNRVFEVPFDSNRKMMTTIHNDNENLIQFTKGGLDVLLANCNYYIDGNEVKELTPQKINEITMSNKEMADDALRVLGAAFKNYEMFEEINGQEDQIETNMIYIGHCGMMDPVKDGVKEAINECINAKIRPIMITGDHLDTAVAIGKRLGIINDASQAITGLQLDELSDEQFKKRIFDFSVYARVQPEHKVRIVEAWKAHGNVVAMSGDGVNDAPSLKKADIGIGMGINGTDVTKSVADMVLADDNFATIVVAVKQGRKIYANIKKAIQFLLSSNISEVVAIFVATMLGFSILRPVHILWINLLTDTFPALALGMEGSEPDIMIKPPRDKSEGIFAHGMAFEMIFQGVIIAFITLAAYFIGHYIESGIFEIANSADGMTMAFLTLSMTEIFHSFNMRSRHHSIFKMKKQNKFLWLSFAGSLLTTLLVIFVPVLSNMFGFETINLVELMISIGLSFTIIPIVELQKFIKRVSNK